MEHKHADAFWGEMSRCEHFVQIYDAEEVFVDTLAGFVSGGLSEGGAVVVIATPEHRLELDRRLKNMGINVTAALAQDQYIVLDADETMRKFLVNGWPDDKLFSDIITGILRRATCGGRKVRAFGEMVALMWAKEYYGATIRLEHLWHEVCQKESLSLFCAYPKNGFAETPTESIARVCALHTKVLAA